MLDTFGIYIILFGLESAAPGLCSFLPCMPASLPCRRLRISADMKAKPVNGLSLANHTAHPTGGQLPGFRTLTEPPVGNAL